MAGALPFLSAFFLSALRRAPAATLERGAPRRRHQHGCGEAREITARRRLARAGKMMYSCAASNFAWDTSETLLPPVGCCLHHAPKRALPMEEHVVTQPRPSAASPDTFAERPAYKWWVTW